MALPTKSVLLQRQEAAREAEKAAAPRKRFNELVTQAGTTKTYVSEGVTRSYSPVEVSTVNGRTVVTEYAPVKISGQKYRVKQMSQTVYDTSYNPTEKTVYEYSRVQGALIGKDTYDYQRGVKRSKDYGVTHSASVSGAGLAYSESYAASGITRSEWQQMKPAAKQKIASYQSAGVLRPAGEGLKGSSVSVLPAGSFGLSSNLALDEAAAKNISERSDFGSQTTKGGNYAFPVAPAVIREREPVYFEIGGRGEIGPDILRRQGSSSVFTKTGYQLDAESVQSIKAMSDYGVIKQKTIIGYGNDQFGRRVGYTAEKPIGYVKEATGYQKKEGFKEAFLAFTGQYSKSGYTTRDAAGIPTNYRYAVYPVAGMVAAPAVAFSLPFAGSAVTPNIITATVRTQAGFVGLTEASRFIVDRASSFRLTGAERSVFYGSEGREAFQAASQARRDVTAGVPWYNVVERVKRKTKDTFKGGGYSYAGREAARSSLIMAGVPSSEASRISSSIARQVKRRKEAEIGVLLIGSANTEYQAQRVISYGFARNPLRYESLQAFSLYAGKSVGKVATPLGAAEGFGATYNLLRQRDRSLGERSRIPFTNIETPVPMLATGAGLGAASAGTLGYYIAKYKTLGKFRGNVALGAGYALDPAEAFGDFSVSGLKSFTGARQPGFQQLAGGYYPGAFSSARVTTVTPTVSFSSFTPTPASPKVMTASFSPTITATPRGVSTVTPSSSFTPSVIPSFTPTTTTTPTTMTTPTPTPSPSTTFTFTPTTTTTPTLTPTLTPTVTPTTTVTPTFTPTFTPTPTFQGGPFVIPPKLPGGGGGGFSFGRRRIKGSARGYTPSAFAVAFNIVGRKPSKGELSTGLGLRPLLKRAGDVLGGKKKRRVAKKVSRRRRKR